MRKDNYYSFNFKVTRQKGNKTYTTEHSDHLYLNDDFRFSEIIRFMDNFKDAVDMVIRKCGDYADGKMDGYLNVEGELSVSWDDMRGNDTIEHVYRRWYIRNIEDINSSKGEESIYLVPDTRYVDESIDAILTKKNPFEVFEDLGI